MPHSSSLKGLSQFFAGEFDFVRLCGLGLAVPEDEVSRSSRSHYGPSWSDDQSVVARFVAGMTSPIVFSPKAD